MAATLLLADDSVTIQRVIELTFADEDVDVITVSDGDQAIARVERQPPDIVLADIGMPGRSGYEVSGYIKDSPHLAHIPVILLTGAFEPVDRHKATAAKCDGVLAKPFEPQLVISRVKELLNRSRSSGDAAKSSSSWESPAMAAPDGEADLALAPPASAARPSTADLNDYFDQLDAAFARLPSPGAEIEDWPIRHQSPEHEPDHQLGPPPREVESGTAVWDLTVPESWKPEVPVSVMPRESPSPASTSLERPSPPEVSQIPSAPGSPASSSPALADAFAALLAAEQNHDPGRAADAWAPRPILTDEAIDQIVERVLARMSDPTVRAMVTDIVSKVAERLVREEIDRIKGAIE